MSYALLNRLRPYSYYPFTYFTHFKQHDQVPTSTYVYKVLINEGEMGNTFFGIAIKYLTRILFLNFVTFHTKQLCCRASLYESDKTKTFVFFFHFFVIFRWYRRKYNFLFYSLTPCIAVQKFLNIKVQNKE